MTVSLTLNSNMVPEPQLVTVPREDLTDLLIASLQAAEYLDQVVCATGVCCCGEDMDGHSSPLTCGHTPVDSGEYHASTLVQKLHVAVAIMRNKLAKATDKE